MRSHANRAIITRLLLRVSVLIPLSMGVLDFFESNASAHDPSGMSARDIVLEQALADARDQRDQIVRSQAASPQTKDEVESVMASLFKWVRLNGILTVCFWANPRENAAVTDTAEEKEIATIASKWVTNAAISFQFYDGDGLKNCKDHATSDIRVTLYRLDNKYYSQYDPMNFDWSRYGKQSDGNPALVSLSLVQAHLAYLNGNEAYFRFNVAHEFGHALGLMHEHQRIDCVKWLTDDATVMKIYDFKTNNDLKVFKNNLAKIPASNIYYRPETTSQFDPHSVMMYNFPPQIWKNVPGNPCLRTTPVEYPDADDVQGILAIYGARVAQNSPAPAVNGAPPVSLGPPVNAAPPVPSPAGSGSQPEVLSRLDAQKQAMAAQIEETRKAAAEIIARGNASVRFQSPFGIQIQSCVPTVYIGGNTCIQFQTNDGGRGARLVQEQEAGRVRELQDNILRLDRMRSAISKALELGTN